MEGVGVQSSFIATTVVFHIIETNFKSNDCTRPFKGTLWVQRVMFHKQKLSVNFSASSIRVILHYRYHICMFCVSGEGGGGVPEVIVVTFFKGFITDRLPYIRFLVEHGFDFQKQYSLGVSYLRGNDR
jgi:hypothetical protein